MEIKDNKTNSGHVFMIIAGLILAHRDKSVNDIDLYNSILRLIYFHANDNLEEIETVVRWLEQEEKNNVNPQIQYLRENVVKNVGENYYEGLETIVVPVSFYEEIIKKYEN